MESQTEVKDSFRLLVLASAITLVLWFIPFGDAITYPIRLFVTFIHESGHALAALATFGGVNRVALDWSGSGVTETVGGAGFLISSAGYLSTTLYGSGLLLLIRRLRHLKAVAIGTGVLFLAMTVLFGGNLLAWLAGLAFGVGSILLGLKVKPRLAQFVLSFLAVQSVLNAFYDLRTLLYLSAFDSSRPTDAQNMAVATGGFVPAMVWALLWSLISLAILLATMVTYYKSLRQQAAVVEDIPIPLFIEDRPRSAADRPM
jgi:Peptidase M50B-like